MPLITPRPRTRYVAVPKVSTASTPLATRGEVHAATYTVRPKYQPDPHTSGSYHKPSFKYTAHLRIAGRDAQLAPRFTTKWKADSAVS